MPFTVQSSRFGAVEVPDEAVIEFPHGIIGLPGTRWTLMAREPDSDFLWLHSLEDMTVALPVTNPWLFFADYELEIADGDAGTVGLDSEHDPDVYVTVRAAENLEDCYANLRAPIIVFGGKGQQVINQIPAPVRAPLFEGTLNLAEEPTQQLETSVG